MVLAIVASLAIQSPTVVSLKSKAPLLQEGAIWRYEIFPAGYKGTGRFFELINVIKVTREGKHLFAEVSRSNSFTNASFSVIYRQHVEGRQMQVKVGKTWEGRLPGLMELNAAPSFLPIPDAESIQSKRGSKVRLGNSYVIDCITYRYEMRRGQELVWETNPALVFPVKVTDSTCTRILFECTYLP